MDEPENKLFAHELSLAKMWADGEIEFFDLPEPVQKALIEVFENPETVDATVVQEPTIEAEAPVQHLDLLFKANDEHRFTLGPWYIPNRYDAHGEWTDATELQNALWDYVKSGDRDIRLQHNRDIVAGEWLEAMSFPVPVTIGMNKASTEPIVYPAGTVFLGVQWKPWAWDMVKAGKIRGFSIGGAAARIEMEIPEDVSKASFGGDRSEAGRYAANVRWRALINAKATQMARLQAKLEVDSKKEKKGNIAERIKNYFTTLPEPMDSKENLERLKARRADENFVDDTSIQAVSLPSGKTVFLGRGKLKMTDFPKEGLTAGRGRPMKMAKPKTPRTGKRPSQFLDSGYGGKPVVKRPIIAKSENGAKYKSVIDAKVKERLAKNNPTSSAVHVDTIMGGKKKKKKRSKIMVDDVEKRGGLDKWFDEKWVDISRKKEGGGYEECGRPDATEGKYPKCVPSSTASSMSESERKSAVSRKRKAERKGNREGKKPINVKTFTKSENVPTDKKLYARVKAEAKRKFDVYPSAYANAWLVREYKKRGGGYRVKKASSPAWQRSAGKNPKGGLNAKGRASYKRETGGTLKPPVKRGDNPRRASFLARMGNMPGPERDAEGNPTRLLLSLQAWGANSKAEARKKAKAISARNKNKKKIAKASFGGDRSAAGRYAAEQRWKGHVKGATRSGGTTKSLPATLEEKLNLIGRGRVPMPKTEEGKKLMATAPSLATHCNFDNLAKELSRRGLTLDSFDAPAIVLSHLSKSKKAEILNFVTKSSEGVPVNPEGPIVFVKGGGGASGKSSSKDSTIAVPPTKENLKEGEQPKAVISNADDYKVVSSGFTKLRDEAIAEADAESAKKGFKDGSKEHEDMRQEKFAKYQLAAFVHEESSIVGKLVSSFALQKGMDLVIDGTMDNGLDKRNAELDKYRSMGARAVHGLFYSCDTDTAVARSAPRARRREGKDYGRQVPEVALRNAHAGVSKNFPSFVTQGKFDSITLYDTNDGESGQKQSRVIARTNAEGNFVVEDQKAYDRFLAKANEKVG